MEEETTFHSLTQCEFAISFCDKFRALTGIKLPKLCPRTWTRDLLENSFCSEEDRGVILCGMWSLWRGRNDRRHAKRPIDPGAALDWALEVCRQLTKTKQASTQQAQPVPWCSPEVGTLKINIDGSFLQNSHTGATGALMRDSNGVLRAASARCLDSVGSALQAEAEALRDGVRLIPEGSTEHVILETDSQELVSLWKNKSKYRSEVTAILGDIEEMITTLPSVRIVHTRRSANYAAHLCAQHASACLQSFIFFKKSIQIKFNVKFRSKQSTLDLFVESSQTWHAAVE
jgi:ribonuclease HI